MNERVYSLARQAEEQAREHVRDCETYGYTMFEGTAEDEFHAEFRDRFAELIVRECAAYIFVLDAEPVSHKSAARMLMNHFGVE